MWFYGNTNLICIFLFFFCIFELKLEFHKVYGMGIIHPILWYFRYVIINAGKVFKDNGVFATNILIMCVSFICVPRTNTSRSSSTKYSVGNHLYIFQCVDRETWRLYRFIRVYIFNNISTVLNSIKCATKKIERKERENLFGISLWWQICIKYSIFYTINWIEI